MISIIGKGKLSTHTCHSAGYHKRLKLPSALNMLTTKLKKTDNLLAVSRYLSSNRVELIGTGFLPIW